MLKKILFVFSVLLISLVGCKKEIKPEGEPPGVIVVPASMGSVMSTMEIIGQGRAFDEVDLVARVQGFLVKRTFTEGQLVKKGDLLFEIEKEQYQASVQSAEATLMKMQAIFKDKETDFERQKKLLAENVIAQKVYDNSLYAYMEAKANVMGAQADLDNDKLNLSYTTISAPFDGRIGLSTYSEGNLVGPNSKKLANIVKLDPIRVQFNLNELDVISINLEKQKTEQRARDSIVVKVQFQNGVVYDTPGEISFVDNKINSSTGTILVEALFSNPKDTIVPGMYVKVLLQDKEKKEALLIPQSSTQESQAGKSVLVVGADNKVSQRIIKTGIKAGPDIQVTDGLKEGELVIVEGMQKVRSGMLVKPVVDKPVADKPPKPEEPAK